LIATLLLLAGCEETPDAKMKISPNGLTVQNDIDSELISIDIVRTDVNNSEAMFSLEIENFKHINVVDTQGIEKYKYQTKPLHTKGEKDTIQFKLRASKDGFNYAMKTLDVVLKFNEMEVQREQLKVEIR
jgi:hypothetical protein